MNAFRFKIRFAKPITLQGQEQTIREGVLIEQRGQWAEASPLPGFSAETIDDVIAALRGLQPPPASLQFALESLETPLESSKPAPISVPWNYLLLGDRKQVLNDVENCIQTKCRAVKLKVGRGDLSAEVELVKEVRKRLPDQVQLRLDANQAWSLEEAVTFFDAVEGVDLQYVEEPLQDSNLLEELYARTGARYALDETLLRERQIEAWPNVVALVCKPTILGGRDRIQQLVATGKPVIFSAAFESGVGVARIAQLAAELSPEHAAGLDTLDWLADDLLIQSPKKQNDMFVVPETLDVAKAKLEAIEL